jgi:hypothetical protein
MMVPRRYTTANPENLDQDFQGTDFKAPMAGFGVLLRVVLFTEADQVWGQATGCQLRASTPSISVAI